MQTHCLDFKLKTQEGNNYWLSYKTNLNSLQTKISSWESDKREAQLMLINK